VPISVCLEPGCPSPATWRGRCNQHARQRDKTIARAGYRTYKTAKWRRTRSRYLARHPVCELCDRAIAEQVHHVIDLADGGSAWAEANLQALCAPCHSKVTRRRQLAPQGRVAARSPAPKRPPSGAL
jgi:5-methylcytosine-specific restriction protein A